MSRFAEALPRLSLWRVLPLALAAEAAVLAALAEWAAVPPRAVSEAGMTLTLVTDMAAGEAQAAHGAEPASSVQEPEPEPKPEREPAAPVPAEPLTPAVADAGPPPPAEPPAQTAAARMAPDRALALEPAPVLAEPAPPDRAPPRQAAAAREPVPRAAARSVQRSPESAPLSRSKSPSGSAMASAPRSQPAAQRPAADRALGAAVPTGQRPGASDAGPGKVADRVGARRSGVVQPVAYRSNPRPAYPREARERRQEGTVRLRVLVDPKGRPIEVQIAASSGVASLDAAAVAAVRRWRFSPARQAGQASAAWVLIPARFKLTG